MKIVKENINFNRGDDPRSVLGLSDSVSDLDPGEIDIILQELNLYSGAMAIYVTKFSYEVLMWEWYDPVDSNGHYAFFKLNKQSNKLNIEEHTEKNNPRMETEEHDVPTVRELKEVLRKWKEQRQ